jgi:AAA family ATPase
LQEAGFAALKRAVAKGQDPGVEACISMPDLVAGMRHVRPSAMREVLFDIPRVKWNDIGGQEETKQRLKCDAVLRVLCSHF